MHFLILVALSFLVGLLGRRRKFGFWGYFFGSILLTPIVGLLLVMASDPGEPEPGKKEGAKKDTESDDLWENPDS